MVKVWRRTYLRMRKLKRERREELAKAAGAMEMPRAKGPPLSERPFLLEIVVHNTLDRATEDVRSRALSTALERLVTAGVLAGKLPKERAETVLSEWLPSLKRAWEEIRG